MRATGNGKTPERVVHELRKAVDSSSLLAVSNATGVGISALHRYLKGIGEPTTATLEKLGAYFGVSVWWLRGDDLEYSKVMKDYNGLMVSHEKRVALMEKYRELVDAFIRVQPEDKQDAINLLQHLHDLPEIDTL